jgi:hypothetical protein
VSYPGEDERRCARCGCRERWHELSLPDIRGRCTMTVPEDVTGQPVPCPCWAYLRPDERPAKGVTMAEPPDGRPSRAQRARP